MKKVLLFAAIILLVVAAFLLVRGTTVGYVFDEGWLLTDDALVKNLQRENPDEDAQTIAAKRFEYGDTRTKSIIGTVIGEERHLMVAGVPLYARGGAALLNTDDSALLIDSDLDMLHAYDGLYVIDGYTYNADLTQADLQRFILLSLENGMFMNLQPLHFETVLGDADLPANSLINFTSAYINYYAQAEGEFTFGQITAITGATTLTFEDGSVFQYMSLLEKLGVIKSTQTKATAVPTAEPAATPTQEPSVTPTTRPTQTAGGGTGADSSGATAGQTGGMITPEAAATPTQRPSPTPQPDATALPAATVDPNATPAPIPFVMPSAELTNLTTDVYSASATLTVDDYSGCIVKGARIEFYKDGKLFVRKAFSASADITITPLMPDTDYEVVGTFTYRDVYGIKKDVTFYTGSCTTRSISELTPLDLSVQTGEVFAKRVVFTDILIGNYLDEGAQKTLNAVSVGNVTVGTTEFRMTSAELIKLKGGQAAGLTSSSSLDSNQTFTYTWELHDRFGNVLPLTEAVTGTIRTCYSMPSATLTLTKNEVANTQIRITIVNPDGLAFTDAQLVLTDMNGGVYSYALSGSNENVTLTDLAPNMAYAAEVRINYDLDDGNGLQEAVAIGTMRFSTLSIASLGYAFLNNSVVDIDASSAKARFSLNTGKIHATLLFLLSDVTMTIGKSGGDTVLSVTLTDDTEGGALYALKNGGSWPNEQTDETVAAAAVFSITNGVVTVAVDGLDSVTEYAVELTAKAEQGGKFYDVKTSYTTASFKTLKKMPAAAIENAFSTPAYIEIYNTCVSDPDNAILSNVILRVTDNTGRVITTFELAPNVTYERLKVEGLEKDTQYTFTFTATQMNRGYNKASLETAVRLEKEYKVWTVESIYGSLELSYLMGYDNATASYMGGNLFDASEAELNKNVYPYDNRIINNNGRFASGKIPVTPGVTYAFNNCYTSSATYMNFYTEDDARIAPTSGASYRVAYGAYVAPEGAAYLRFGGMIAQIDKAECYVIASPDTSNDLLAGVRVQLTDTNSNLGTDPSYRLVVYKNGRRVSNTTYGFTQGTGVDTVVEQILQKGSKVSPDTYLVELYVEVYRMTILIDSLEFTNEEPIHVIDEYSDMQAIAFDPDGKYLVVEDITSTSNAYIMNSNNGSFLGKLNFDGHTYTPYSGSQYYWFYSIGRGAVIENVVIEYPYAQSQSMGYQNSVIGTYNNGTIRNVSLHLSGTEYSTYETVTRHGGALVHTNSAMGTIENFSIDLGGDWHVREYFGGVCYTNSGKIRNGRIYGGDVYAHGLQQDTGYQMYYIGYAVGLNYGAIENTYAVGNVYCVPEESECNSIGYMRGFAGYSAGRMADCLFSGDFYFTKNGTYVRNTERSVFAATISGKRDIDNCYYYSDLRYTEKYVTAAAKQTLHDKAWHDYVVGSDSGFDVSVVDIGYYPQPELGDAMRGEVLDYLELPELTEADAIDLTSVIVQEQYDDYAIVQFSFTNTAQYQITDIQVEYLNTRILSQKDDEGVARVIARVEPITDGSAPTKYISQYNVYSFTRASAVPGVMVTSEFDKGDFYCYAEFYKSVSTPEQWAQISSDPAQNYRLTNDLDLSSLSAAETVLHRYTGTFAGKLDGRGYTVTGINLGKYSYLFSTLSGTLHDIVFDGIVFPERGGSQTGLIRLISGGDADGVTVKNISLSSYQYAGAICAYLSAGTVRNSAAINVEITAYTTSSLITAELGGLVGLSDYGVVENSFADGISMDASDAVTVHVGALVGRAYQSTVQNCYASGNIRGSTSFIGGLVGNVSSSIIRNVWTDGSVYNLADASGGAIGYAAGGIYAGILVVGDVFCASSSTANTQRISALRATGSDGFAYEGQRVNGTVPLLEDGSIDPMDAARVWSYEELCDEQTYTYEMEWDASVFDFSSVADGFLPQLYSTDGELLPYQTEHSLRKDADITVSHITTATQNGYQVQVTFEHENGVYVDAIGFDYLTIDSNVPPAITREPARTTILVTVTPERYYDSYTLNSYTYTYNSNTVTSGALERVEFSEPLYMEIPNAARWQTVMAERGQNYENFRITGPIDFTGIGDPVINVKINRLDGLGQQTIKNLTISSTTGNVPLGLIYQSLTSVANLTFSNINVTKTVANGNCVGVIARCAGTLANVNFEDITINLVSGTYVGCVGYATDAQYIGNVTLKRITISKGTGNYCGGLIGTTARSHYGSITIEDSSVTSTGNYTGGLFGSANLDYFIATETAGTAEAPVSVTGTSYVGGIYGSASQIMIEPHTDGETVGTRSFTVTYADVTATTSCAGSMFGILTSTYIGYTTSYPQYAFDAVTVDHCTVMAGKDANGNSYAGGVAGGSNYHTIAYATVSNTNVTGLGNYVGGISTYNAVAQNSTVEDSLIIGYGYYVGGINGGLNTVNNCTIKDSGVFGAAYVGGIGSGTATPATGSYTYCLVKNCTVSTIYDARFTQYTGIEALAIPADDTANNYIGGVSGNCVGYIYYSTVIDSTVGAAAADYVGGLCGLTVRSNYFMQFSHVSNSTVVGTHYVGGLAGSANVLFIRYNHCNASIEATGNYVGGLVGYLDLTTVTNGARDNGQYANNYYIGAVSGQTFVAGLFGNVSHDMSSTAFFGNFVAAEVTAVVGTGAIVTNAGGTMATSVAYEFSRATSAGETVYATDAGALPDGVSVVTKATLADTASAKALFATTLKWSATYWDQKPVEYGYMPFVKTGTYALRPYQEFAEVDGSMVYYDMTDFFTEGYVVQGGDPLPQWGAEITGFSLFAFGLAYEALPEAVFSPSGADTLNIEFSAVSEQATFTAFSGTTALFESAITQRVYTMYYDYDTELTVVVSNGTDAETYTIKPSDYARSLSLYGDDYYYICGAGVKCGKGLIPYAMVHIYGGEGIRSDGTVYSLTTGSIVRGFSDFGLCTDVIPLAEGTYGGVPVQMFRETSVFGDSYVDMQAFVKKGELFAVQPDRSYDYLSYTADYLLGKTYLTVLTAEGSLYDLQTSIAVPRDFVNAGIQESTGNLHSDLPYILVRYTDGSVYAFNTRTGEEIDVGYATSDLSLLEYASQFFSQKTTIVGSTSGFSDIVKLEETLTLQSAPELLVAGAYSGEVDIGYGTEVVVAGTEAESTQDTSGTPAVDGTGDADGESQADGTNGGAEDTKEESKESTQVQVENAELQFVAVYDPNTDGYVLYQISELFSGQRPVSVNEKLAGTEWMQGVVKHPEDGTHATLSAERRGLLIVSCIMLAIVSMLTGVLLWSKRRLSVRRHGSAKEEEL